MANSTPTAQVSMLFSGVKLPTITDSDSLTILIVPEFPDYNSPSNLSTAFEEVNVPTGDGAPILFEGSEHTFIGSKVQLKTGVNLLRSGDNPFYAVGDPSVFKKDGQAGLPQVSLSYGQIMALAGDFYGIPDTPISTNGPAAFTNAFNTLLNCDIQELTAILSIMEDEITLVNNALTSGFDVYSIITDIARYCTIRWNRATQANSTMTYRDVAFKRSIDYGSAYTYYRNNLRPSGRYLSLAGNNIDHFGTNALVAYYYGHYAALQAASQGNLNQAYAYNAFADHFLSDLFSSGHLRTPRVTLNGSSTEDVTAKAMHDEDSKWGLCVQNSNGNKWRCFGDGMYFSQKNLASAQIAQMAIQASADEVYSYYNKPDLPISPFMMAAFKYIPFFKTPLDYKPNEYDRVNFCPLIIRQTINNRRFNINDLNDYSWSSVFLYALTALDMNDPKKYHPSAPDNFPTAPAKAPTVIMNPLTGSTAQNPLWVSGNKVRYAVSYVWEFIDVFPGAYQSSDISAWSDWVDIVPGSCTAISIDAFKLGWTAGFRGWNFSVQFLVNGVAQPFGSVGNPIKNGVVTALTPPPPDYLPTRIGNGTYFLDMITPDFIATK